MRYLILVLLVAFGEGAVAGMASHSAHDEVGSEFAKPSEKIAILFPSALRAAEFLQRETGRAVRHQGTEATGGHVHFDLLARGVGGRYAIYDICPHPELGADAIMHFAEKRPEWIQPIEGHPGYYAYQSIVPRMIIEVSSDGSVNPYNGNLISFVDELVAAGWAGDTMALNLMLEIIAEAERRGFVHEPSTSPSKSE